MERQDGDEVPSPFSFLNTTVPNASNQVSCFMTYTNPTTHQVVKDNMHNSVHIQETKKGNHNVDYDVLFAHVLQVRDTVLRWRPRLPDFRTSSAI